jgi:hypothetical protein
LVAICLALVIAASPYYYPLGHLLIGHFPAEVGHIRAGRPILLEVPFNRFSGDESGWHLKWLPDRRSHRTKQQRRRPADPEDRQADAVCSLAQLSST